MVPPEYVEAEISDKLLEAVKMRRETQLRRLQAKEALAAKKSPSI